FWVGGVPSYSRAVCCRYFVVLSSHRLVDPTTHGRRKGVLFSVRDNCRHSFRYFVCVAGSFRFCCNRSGLAYLLLLLAGRGSRRRDHRAPSRFHFPAVASMGINESS